MKESDLKQTIHVGLCLVLLLAGCLACAPKPQVAPAPGQSDVTLEEWAARYPAEYSDWKDSVHGTAYLAGDTDAPGCTSCHADPASGEIETAAFRLDIPTRCASCHADQAKMARHDLPADTYATYVADDYHGKTIAYYRNHDTTTWRYEAVCSDCHGSHAVYGPEDPRSSVAQGNLLTTCQQCHLGAAPHFVDFASGHFRTALARSPLVHYVSLAYRILIPLVIGLMLAYIALDIVHRLRRRAREESHG
jgi:hypothetical protein